MPPAPAWSPHIEDVQPAVLRWLRRMGHGDASLDVWHRAVEQVLATGVAPDPDRAPRAYLWTAARREAWRPTAEAVPLGDEVFSLVAPDGDPFRLAERAETRARVGEAVASLPDGFRAVLVGRFLEGRTATEVAHDLAIPPNTVASRTHRALGILRNRLADVRDAVGLLVVATLGLTFALRPAPRDASRLVGVQETGTVAVSGTERGPVEPAPVAAEQRGKPSFPVRGFPYGDGYTWVHRPHPEI